MNAGSLPKFDAPPVVETALGIQFSRLPSFTTAMAGWFWKSYLPKSVEWVKAVDAPRLEDEFEKFDEPERFGHVGLKMMRIEPQRTQIVREGEERMIQVQDSRLILNWRKRSGTYPSFDVLAKEFWQILPEFERFAVEAGLGAIEPNQWEVTYVNHVPKGELWQSPRDWARIITATTFPSAPDGLLVGETANYDWRYALSEQRGRLYVGIRHAQVRPSLEEVLQLTLTARGPIIPARGLFVSQGFELGHEVIVRTFTAMTTAEAHRHWKRRS